MPRLSEQEHKLARGYVEEFSEQALTETVKGYQCIYRSHDFGDTRFLLRVETAFGDYALKIDLDSPMTGRLRKEYELLTRLARYFEASKTTRVVQPVYESPGNTFFVTEFVDRPTAADIIHNGTDNERVAQIYRRAGGWLHDLHDYHPAKDYGFRPKWMTDSIQELLDFAPMDIRSESQEMLGVLLAESRNLKGIPEVQVFSHGDFHSQNLIVGQGKMIGLDFTEAREKLAVYDIVDFLKSDIFRDAEPTEVDRSGILKTNKDMFFRRYRHPIHTGILDFCIRGRLLKDWLVLWHRNHDCSAYEEDRRDRLGYRLRIAFDIWR